MSSTPDTDEPQAEEQAAVVAPMIDPARRAARLEWLVVVGALTGPLIVYALQSRVLYGPLAPALNFYDHPLSNAIGTGVSLAATLTLLLYILHLRGVGLRTLGFRPIPASADVVWGIGLCIAVFGFDVALFGALGESAWVAEAEYYIESWRESGADLRWTWPVGLVALAASMLLVGAVEESLRAYVIVRFDAAWGGGIVMGAWVSFLLFMLYHVYYSGIDLVAIGITGAEFTVYFVARRDAWALVIAHALLDIVVLAWWYVFT